MTHQQIKKCLLSKFKRDKTFENFSLDVYNQIEFIPVKDWDSVCEKDKIFFDRNYFHSLEKSNPVALTFRYVILKENEKPVAGFYFQLLNMANRELGSILNLKKYGILAGRVNKALNKFIFSVNDVKPNYLIVCGNLFVSGEYGISFTDKTKAEIIYKSLPTILDFLQNDLKEESDVCAFLVKDFFDVSLLEIVTDKENFSRLPMDPEMIFLMRQWNSFDDYLESLSAKYRLRANNAIKKISKLLVKELSIEEIKKFSKKINELYLQVQENASVRMAKVNPEYFIQLKKNLGDNFYMKAFFRGDEMIAFMSGLVNHGNHEAHLIGIDYRFNKSHALYQNILYQFISDAIEKKSQRLFFGRTAMEIKTTVGAKAFGLHTYFRLSNSFLNKMAKHFLKRSKPEEWIARSPFRNGD